MRNVIIVGSLIVVIASASLFILLRWEPEGPSVVLITMDMVRADHLEPYGYEKRTSLHISRLAKDGIVFEDAYTPATLSAPAHASMLTGVRPEHHRVVDNVHKLPADVVTLAERMQAAGYDTAGFVSSILVGDTLGLDQGFGTFVVNAHPDHTHQIMSMGQAQRTYKSASAWLRERERRPFFLWVHAQNGHFDFNPPLPFEAMFIEEAPKRPSPFDCIWDINKALKNGETIPEDAQARNVARYDAEIAVVDTGIGAIIDAVSSTPAAKNTIFVIVSDHGVSLFERTAHKKADHVWMHFEEDVRVPLVVNAPGFEPRRVSGFVETTSIYETIAELAGLPTVPGERAVSLVGAMRTGKGADTFPLLAWPPSKKRGHAVRQGDWKLIVDRDGTHLYNLADDPGETIDLATENPDKIAELTPEADRLVARWAEVKEQYKAQENGGTDVAANPAVLEVLRRGGYLEDEMNK